MFNQKNLQRSVSISHYEPLVSIILPTYNRGHVIGKAIKSILNQTYRNFELIIVDDGPDDNTQSIVDSFRDGRIRYIKKEMRLGVSKARNSGLGVSRGDYIAFIDSDDSWFPEKLLIQLKDLQDNPDYGVTYCSGWIVKNGRTFYLSFSELGSGDISDKILFIYPVLGMALFRRSCFQQVGLFDTNLTVGEDYDLFIRVASVCQFNYIDDPLVTLYQSNEGVSHDPLLDLLGRKIILKKHWQRFIRNPKVLQREFLYIGLDLANVGYMQPSRSIIKQSIRIKPTTLKCYLAYILSFLGKNIFSYIDRYWANLKKDLFGYARAHASSYR